ncbi:hypothetical protein DWB77_04017 [Streptomyces hundungensis]|uniref:Uncharacterized protein n=1 Tax=Streptomyces hundungensis TaxID=1077946 RepID=A0A387HM04_9ACTN|nr:hypothetical protein [Streptomyces hundungensis]AYG81850.1 hypothetical protein DWB77_04017 [Streptomyces hundungensis]
MRIQLHRQAERSQDTPQAAPVRQNAALAELHRTVGNAALSRLLAPAAPGEREPGERQPRERESVPLQRIATHEGGSYDAEDRPGERGPFFVAQGPEPKVAMGGGGEPRDIRERLRYELAEVGPADAPLRVADDGTLAVHGVAEPKEFYAVQAVVDSANEALRAANSTVELVTGGRSIGVGGHRLLRVQPSVVRDATAQSQLGPFVSLLRSTCISVACSLIGSEHAKRAQAVLGGGDGNFLLTPNSDSDTRANRLADAVARDTTSTLDVDGAVAAADGAHAPAPDLGRRYGEATRDGGRDATEERLGINKYASPGPGDGFAIFSMLAQDGLDHSVSPAAERGEDVWGYHFAAVVARSLDGTCQVTLENYARNEFDAKARSELYEVLLQRANASRGWFAQLKPLLESDDQQAFKAKFDEVLAALVSDPEVKKKRGMPRLQLQQDFEDHTCRSWFFRVYGGGPGESFHEQQAASGYFNNPMTLRVARPQQNPNSDAP